MPKHARSCDGGPCPETKASTRHVREPRVRGRKRGRPWRKTGIARCPKRRRTMPFLAAHYPSLRVIVVPVLQGRTHMLSDNVWVRPWSTGTSQMCHNLPKLNRWILLRPLAAFATMDDGILWQSASGGDPIRIHVI